MKIQFTKENKTQLEQLFIELCFDGSTLSGKFGANQLTPYDLLNNTSIDTLRNMRSSLKKEIDVVSNTQDEWSFKETEKSKLDNKKKWEQFLYLLIGYKLSLREAYTVNQELLEAKKQLADMKEKLKTPDERMKELEEKITNLEKEKSE